LLGKPLLFEFDQGYVPQSRLDALVHIHIIRKAADLMIGVIVISILQQVNYLFLDGADQPLSATVFPRPLTLAMLIWKLQFIP
jgi:hypothetical protein